VLRARPRRMFLGAFFDVPNLTEVAVPVRRCWTVGGGTSPVDFAPVFGSVRSNDGGRVAPTLPGDGVGGCGHAVGVDLEEETEAQEGQGVLVPQGARTSQTNRADNASKVPASKRAGSVASAMVNRFGVSEGERQGGQGSG